MAHERDWGFFLSGRLSSRRPVWFASLGLLAGAGAVCLVVATINAISGELSPTVWASAGTLLTGSGGSGFWWPRCRPAARL